MKPSGEINLDLRFVDDLDWISHLEFSLVVWESKQGTVGNIRENHSASKAGYLILGSHQEYDMTLSKNDQMGH